MRASSSGAGTIAHLLDVQTVDGNFYYWADRKLNNVFSVLSQYGTGVLVNYIDWIAAPPSFKRYRSMQTDTGSITIANVFGDTYARQLERNLRASALEGAIFAYRWWNAAAEMADLEVHGTLTVSNVGIATVTLSAAASFDGSNVNAPEWQFSESCQLVWAGARCGATGSTECLYSLQTCQVPERYVGITNTWYDKDFAAALAAVPETTINRRRGV